MKKTAKIVPKYNIPLFRFHANFDLWLEMWPEGHKSLFLILFFSLSDSLYAAVAKGQVAIVQRLVQYDATLKVSSNSQLSISLELALKNGISKNDIATILTLLLSIRPELSLCFSSTHSNEHKRLEPLRLFHLDLLSVTALLGLHFAKIGMPRHVIPKIVTHVPGYQVRNVMLSGYDRLAKRKTADMLKTKAVQQHITHKINPSKAQMLQAFKDYKQLLAQDLEPNNFENEPNIDGLEAKIQQLKI